MSMKRLLVHVEGETEESFVNEVLGRHLAARGYAAVSARLIGNARQRDRRGGIRPWSSTRRDIVRHLKQDRACIATTMVDYYGLPSHGEKAWPGRAAAQSLSPHLKGPRVEKELLADIVREIGEDFDVRRFVPFVVVHEFEGLLFSDCQAFARSIGRSDLATAFQSIRNQFASPEAINDSPLSAPSKRVAQLVPGYQKPLFGALAALAIGIGAMRRECAHFRTWVDRLEHLGAETL